MRCQIDAIIIQKSAKLRVFCLFEQSSVSIEKNHCGNGTKKHKKPDGVNRSFVTYRVLVILHVQHHMAKRFCSACIVNLFESRIHRGCFRLIRLHVAVVIVANLQFLYRSSKVLTILFIRVKSIRFI